MAIVKKTEKQSFYHGLRVNSEINQRIDDIFNQVLIVQQDIKKSEFLRTALERGLTEIEQQLKAVDKV
jgi:hypothetical protein